MSAWSTMSISAWPTPTVSISTSSLPAASISQRHLQRRLGEAAERAARGHRADEHAGVEEVIGEADAVAEQGALGEGARGVDREHRHLTLGLAQLRGQRADQGALADARGAGEADDAGLAGARVDLADELPTGGVVGLDQRDRPRQGALVAGNEALGERCCLLATSVTDAVESRVPAAVIRTLRFLARNGMLNRRYGQLLGRYLRRRFFTAAGLALAHRRPRLLRPRAANCRSPPRDRVHFGRFVWIGDGTKIRCHEGRVEIGDKTVMGQECTISAYQHVRIGEQCVIADRAMFIDFDHGVVEVERPIRQQGIYKRDVDCRLQRLDRLRRLRPARCQRRRQRDRRHQLSRDQGRPRQRRRRRYPGPDHPHARGAGAAALARSGRAGPRRLHDPAAPGIAGLRTASARSERRPRRNVLSHVPEVQLGAENFEAVDLSSGRQNNPARGRRGPIRGKPRSLSRARERHPGRASPTTPRCTAPRSACSSEAVGSRASTRWSSWPARSRFRPAT